MNEQYEPLGLGPLTPEQECRYIFRGGVMKEAIETERRDILVNYIRQLPWEELKALCDTAADWYGAGNSRMKQFARQPEQLGGDGQAYAQLAVEVGGCLLEIKEKDSPHLAPLLALQKFAMKMYLLNERLSALANVVTALAEEGVRKEDVQRVVHRVLTAVTP